MYKLFSLTPGGGSYGRDGLWFHLVDFLQKIYFPNSNVADLSFEMWYIWNACIVVKCFFRHLESHLYADCLVIYHKIPQWMRT